MTWNTSEGKCDKHIENLFSQLPTFIMCFPTVSDLRVPFLSCIKDQRELHYTKKRRTTTESVTTTGDVCYIQLCPVNCDIRVPEHLHHVSIDKGLRSTQTTPFL